MLIHVSMAVDWHILCWQGSVSAPGLLMGAGAQAQLRPPGALRHRHKAPHLLPSLELHPPQVAHMLAAVSLCCTGHASVYQNTALSSRSMVQVQKPSQS